MTVIAPNITAPTRKLMITPSANVWPRKKCSGNSAASFMKYSTTTNPSTPTTPIA